MFRSHLLENRCLTHDCPKKGSWGKLRLYLYARASAFENKTLDDYKKNKPIGVIVSDANKDEPPEPPSGGGPPNTRKRKGAGMGLMSTTGPVRARTRDLGDGWLMTYDSLTALISVPPAVAEDLENLYTGVMDSAAEQLSNSANATDNLAFKLGSLNLRLSSQAPISWDWIIGFAAEMLDIVGSDFATLFQAQAYSSYWDLPTVAASLTAV